MKKGNSAKTYTTTRSYDGKTAEARRGERRQLLLETGIQLIGDAGYAGVSLNAICAEAGLTKRYFYESFTGVEDLLSQAFHQISTELQQQVIASIAGQSQPEAMIRAGFRAFFEYIHTHPERARIYLVEALSVQALRGDLLGTGGGEVSPFLLETTLRFVEAAPLPRPVMSIMAQGAVGAAIFVGQNWIASGYQQPLDELVQGVSEICFGMAARLNIPLDSTL